MYQHRPSNSTRELLEFVALMTPGETVMVALRSIDVSSLSDEDAVLFLQLHQRVAAWWSGVGMSATVAAVAGEPVIDEYLVPVRESEEQRVIRIADARREELAAALRQSPALTQQQIDTARLLAGPLTATKTALDAGTITDRHVAVLVNQARRLPGFWMRDPAEVEAFTAACAVLQARVLPVAARGTLVATRAAAVRAVHVIDPDGCARRRQQALGVRDVWLAHELDGTSLLMARLATEQAVAVMTQINADAHDRAFDVDCPAGMTLGQHRADVLTDLVLTGRVTGSDGATAAPITAHLNITIPLDALLCLRDSTGEEPGETTGRDTSPGDSAELTGVGPISAHVVRDLLADPHCAVTLRRLVTDPITGHLLDYGRTTYGIPQRLRDYITARDRVCRFPGCTRRADLCEVDHAIAWDDGGDTNPANLGALCKRHHQLKTLGGWDITDSRPDGTCTWRSPQGRVYESGPEPPPRE